MRRIGLAVVLAVAFLAPALSSEAQQSDSALHRRLQHQRHYSGQVQSL